MPSAPFEMSVAVLPGDIDLQNHVNNTVYLRWVQDVATAHWQALASRKAQEAIAWVVLRHEIDYKAPAALGDKLSCAPGSAKPRGLRSNDSRTSGAMATGSSYRPLARCGVQSTRKAGAR